ncbi:MAG: hypothetical protein NVV72_01015 [Asticcacaulis sp.]|nr:hypothetical protein [Asticcacaulis sp.]
MAFPHPTDDALWLEDGATAYAPATAIVAGIFGPKSANITLSDGNMTATNAAGPAFHMARGPVAITGEAYLEFTINALPNPTDSTTGFGLVNAAATNYDTYLTDVNTCGFFSPDNRVGHAPQHQTGFGINAGGYTTFLNGFEWTAGAVWGMAISSSAKTVKITPDGTTWSPEFDISALGTVLYPAVGFYNAGDSITINGGATPFAYAPPAGFAGPDVAGGLMVAYGHVGGSPRTYDFGATQWRGFIAFEPSELDLSDEDETYHLVLETNTAADFTGASWDAASWNLTALNPQDKAIVNTVYNGVHHRYGRLRIDFGGTTPSIKLKAFLRSLLSISPVSQADQITANFYLLDNLTNANKNLRDWSAGTAFGGIYGDGRYPVTDGSGNTLYLPSIPRMIMDMSGAAPEAFGAIGDGNSHPASEVFDTLEALQVVFPFAISLDQELDWLAWQKAIYSGLKISANAKTYKMCNANAVSHLPLTFVSGVSWVEAAGPWWDFSDIVAKTTDEHLVDDYNFALTTGTPWINADTYAPGLHDDATFGGGEATCIDTRTDGTSPFFQFGQLRTLTPGRYTAICTYTAAHGGSYAHHNPTIPFAGLAFFSDSPGVGTNFSGRYGSTRPNVAAVSSTDTVTMTFDFEVTEEVTTWFTFSGGGWADWHVTYMDIQPALLNCAVLMTRDGSPSHYPIMQPLEGVWISGPGYDSGITGVLWKSFANMDGNVQSMASCVVTGFEYGIETSDGAYLVELEKVNVYSNHTGYRHRIGSFNAGENIRWRGGGLYNNAVGIDNDGGAEVNLLQTAVDYNDRAIINNTGIVNGSLTRIEQNTPTAEVPIFHCKPGGKINCSQVYFLGAGGIFTAPVPPVQLDSALSAMTWDNCTIYNLSSATGFVSSGPGILRITNLQKQGNPNIGPLMLSANPVMDILSGAGYFEPQATPFYGGHDDIGLEGGVFAHPDHTQIDRWNTSITTVSVTTAYAYDGTRCLKISKAASADYSKNDPLHILLPTKGGNLMGDFRILIPDDVPRYDTTTIYFREYWVKVIGHDAFGLPIYAPKVNFAGETDIAVPETGSLEWIQRGFGTMYDDDSADPAMEQGFYPPSWATHLLLIFDHQSIPAMDYYFDALRANEVG